MKLEIITPEKKMFEGEVEAVRFPGVDGLFQVLKGHAPIISALAKGQIKVDLAEGNEHLDKYASSFEMHDKNTKVVLMSIKGGVMEMQNDKIIVLAD